MYHYDAVNPDANLDAQHRIAKNLRFLPYRSHYEPGRSLQKDRHFAFTVFLSGKRDKRSHIPAALCIIPVYITSASSI